MNHPSHLHSAICIFDRLSSTFTCWRIYSKFIPKTINVNTYINRASAHTPLHIQKHIPKLPSSHQIQFCMHLKAKWVYLFSYIHKYSERIPTMNIYFIYVCSALCWHIAFELPSGAGEIGKNEFIYFNLRDSGFWKIFYLSARKLRGEWYAVEVYIIVKNVASAKVVWKEILDFVG